MKSRMKLNEQVQIWESSFLLCSSRKKIRTHPMEGHRNILGEGVLKSMKLNCNFLGGLGEGVAAKQKTFHGGLVWIFSGTANA